MGESFADRFGSMTVAEALELNRLAELTCGYEASAVGGDYEGA